MAKRIPDALINYILVGSGDSRRHLQDSPILADVWIAYAENPSEPVDLIITAHNQTTANELAAKIHELVGPRTGSQGPKIAPLQGFVAASLIFEQVLSALMPMTSWWRDPRTVKEIRQYLEPVDNDDKTKLNNTIKDVRKLVDWWANGSDEPTITERRTAFERFVALCSLIMFTKDARAANEDVSVAMSKLTDQALRENVVGLLREMNDASKDRTKMVWQIARNRATAMAINRSIGTVKADAARLLFGIDCSAITWAVVDSGIHAQHKAFQPRGITATFDFAFYREVVDLGNTDDAIRAANLDSIRNTRGRLPKYADRKLKAIASAAVKKMPTRYDLIDEFLKLDEPLTPKSNHGTHVAGIIGAANFVDDESDTVEETAVSNEATGDTVTVTTISTKPKKPVTGMCPGIGLYDLRILGPDEKETEFAVIAALQFVRRVNELAGLMQINGVNISLSIEHDVRNYACGATPICVECERLVESGVVVIAAAGNLGYARALVNGQSVSDYRAFSITDPGNAERVITVGATHRFMPFTYGVSYFSSRGPTGDGRHKPDIVAPGERIYGPVSGENEWDYLDGTSMAAPHVSGAAALLMARYPELIGKPDTIKRILCETATDLGRERHFQGHGLLDVLRALQSQ